MLFAGAAVATFGGVALLRAYSGLVQVAECWPVDNMLKQEPTKRHPSKIVPDEGSNPNQCVTFARIQWTGPARRAGIAAA